jgi:hypothetical protein
MGSEHLEKWSNKGWHARRGMKCERGKESIVQKLGLCEKFYHFFSEVLLNNKYKGEHKYEEKIGCR